ncbi:MAG TPA: papain-like cysteine protease family protein [Caulobacterales bacterium]|nr:papain-like cysteine protease family protein [Caulobacterales bacterium]
MTNAAGRVLALWLGLGASGCAVTPTPDVTAFASDTAANSFEMRHARVEAPGALVLPVVHDRQTEGPACGAHALASVVNYWRGPGTLDGSSLFRRSPPLSASGYSMAELLSLARANGLLASAVEMPSDAIVHELESGRPVLVPVQLPSIYVQQRTLPGAQTPVIELVRNALINRTARVSEWTHLTMVNHYLLVTGYEHRTFVVVEPVMGFRTISFDKLERYRRPFHDAAIVFSAPAGQRMAGG